MYVAYPTSPSGLDNRVACDHRLLLRYRQPLTISSVPLVGTYTTDHASPEPIAQGLGPSSMDSLTFSQRAQLKFTLTANAEAVLQNVIASTLVDRPNVIDWQWGNEIMHVFTDGPDLALKLQTTAIVELTYSQQALELGHKGWVEFDRYYPTESVDLLKLNPCPTWDRADAGVRSGLGVCGSGCKKSSKRKREREDEADTTAGAKRPRCEDSL